MRKASMDSLSTPVALATFRPVLTETILLQLRGLLRDIFDPYRPELHYMRGPGPAWRAKHPGHQPALEPRGVKELAASAS